MRKQTWMAAAIAMLVASGASLNAADTKNMTPEQKAQMEQFMKYATPGEKHKAAGKQVGLRRPLRRVRL